MAASPRRPRAHQHQGTDTPVTPWSSGRNPLAWPARGPARPPPPCHASSSPTAVREPPSSADGAPQVARGQPHRGEGHVGGEEREAEWLGDSSGGPPPAPGRYVVPMPIQRWDDHVMVAPVTDVGRADRAVLLPVRPLPGGPAASAYHFGQPRSSSSASMTRMPWCVSMTVAGVSPWAQRTVTSPSSTR